MGGAATAAVWRWKADRQSERMYVLAVGTASTLWTMAAWWASPGHDWLFWSALAGAVGAGVPRWWHYRRRSKVTVRRGAPRGARRELRRIVKNWPELSEDMELAGSDLQRAEADEIGYTLTLALHAGLTARDVTNKLERVESVLETRTGAARVIADAGRANRAVLRIVNNDPLATPIPWPGTNATSIKDPIVLGRFEDGDPVAIRLVGEHVLTAGTMGRGKSGVLNAFMAELSSRRDVVLWGIDMKRGLELSPWRPVLDRLATTEDAAHELLSAANRVLDARADLLAKRKERKWQPTPKEPALVIAVDELAELTADAMALLERLARMGRAEGIILIAVTQRPSADVLGGLDARTQMTARIALGVVEPRDGELILGAGRG
jgi:DNA segregation ATPase FtsK/SpoIIIE, S-DNA-T family